MKYHMVRRISEIDIYLKQQDVLQSLEGSLHPFNLVPKIPSVVAQSGNKVDEHYGEYNSFRNKLKRYNKRITTLDVSEIVSSLYEFLKEDELITETLAEALVLLDDLDTRTLSMLLGLRQYYSGCFISEDVDIGLSSENWLRALEIWAFTKSYKEPWHLEKILPQTHEDLVDFYSQLLFILHIPQLFVQHDDPKGALVYNLNKQLEHARKEIEELQEKFSELNRSHLETKETSERKLQELNSKRYADLRGVSAEYNKVVSSQAKELQRLRELLAKERVEVPESKLEESPLYPLPEYGVTFIGGSPAMLERLKKEHPAWDIIESGLFPDQYPANEFCFVNASVIPHKQFYHIKSNCRSVVLCCNLTNVSRIEQELQTAYTRYVLGTSGESK